MKWKRIEIEAKEKDNDIISFILYNNGASGLEIIDPKDIEIIKSDEESWAVFDRDDFIDNGLIKIRAYFEEGIAIKIINSIKKDLVNNKSLSEYTIKIDEIDDEDFANNWKSFYKPIKTGQKLIICPEWEDIDPGDRILIKIDPGMAFGTGDHETTKLTLEAMERFIKAGMIVFDIGTGSGILAIAAKLLGAKRVLATDIDNLAIKASKENAKLNNIELDIKEGNLLDVVEGKADLIVSNIIAEILVRMVPDLKRVLSKDGIFIASGIIDERLDVMIDALKDFEILEVNRENGWNSIVARVNNA